MFKAEHEAGFGRLEVHFAASRVPRSCTAYALLCRLELPPISGGTFYAKPPKLISHAP